MSPKLVLTLWRERWKKDTNSTRRVPYLRGKVNVWGDQLTRNNAWSMPVIALMASVVCLAIFLFIADVALTTATQILFSACLAGAALYLRRYEGMLITLILAGMSLLASIRYLNWRFSAIFDQAYSPASLLALSLCLAELYLWIIFALNHFTTIWPLKQASIRLPADAGEWPTVDVFITVRGRSLEEVRHVTSAALALEWPAAKQKIYLLGDPPQVEIREFARQTGVRHLILNDTPYDEAGIFNRAASQTEGELIAVFQCDQAPSPKFLTKAVGWFIKDPKLGMVQTPRHFLAPNASDACLSVFSGEKPAFSCALIRRSALSAIDKVNPNTVMQEKWTLIQRQSYSNSLIGFTATKIWGSEDFDKSREEKYDLSSELFLVDNPSSESPLLWKRRLIFLQQLLKFYFFIPKFILFTAPLAYILGFLDIFHATPSLLLAYFFPHLVHIYFLTGRFEDKNRLTVLEDVKEVTLAWYLLLPTAASLMRTELGRIKNLFTSNKQTQNTSLDWITSWSYGIFILLNLTGFIFGVQYGLTSGKSVNPMYLLCLTWVFCNILFLVAALAIKKESLHLQWHAQQQLRQAAMIKLPSGRTMTGMTENFPGLSLTISLPIRPSLETGTVIGLSIFRGQEEFAFTAKVTTNCDQCFRITILESSQSSYQALGTMALSRDERGPQWLPGRDADQPLPKWLSKPLMAALGKFFVFAENLGLPSKVNLLASWIKYRGKTT